MAQLMPLPLTVSCFSKIQIVFTFLVPAHPGSRGQRAVKRVCVCVCDMDVFSHAAAAAAGRGGDVRYRRLRLTRRHSGAVGRRLGIAMCRDARGLRASIIYRRVGPTTLDGRGRAAPGRAPRLPAPPRESAGTGIAIQL